MAHTFRLALGLLVAAALAPALAMAAPTAGSSAQPVPRLAISLDPARIQLGRQIIGVAYPPKQRDAMLDKLVSAILAQYRASIALPPVFDDPGLQQIINNAFDNIPNRLKPIMDQHFPKLLDAMARAYAREFSLDELRAILVFAQTPPGQHYLSRASATMGDPDVAAANTVFLTQVHVVSKQIGLDVKDQLKAYLAAHPDIAAKLGKSSDTAGATAR
jgi:hypothetical protein